MSDEKPAENLHGEVLTLWRRILGADALQVLAFGIFCAAAVLYATHAMAAERDAKIDAGVAPVAEEVAALKRVVASDREAAAVHAAQVDARMVAVERSTLETSLNVQLLVRAAKLTPIELPRPQDGGP